MSDPTTGGEHGWWPAVGDEELDWPVPSVPMSRTQRRRVTGPHRASIPVEIASIDAPSLPPTVAADAEDAVTEIARFDVEVGHRLLPFSTLLLRSESAASSKIENLTASAKAIALAELGRGRGTNAPLIVANGRAMQAAIDLAGSLDGAAIIAMQAALLGDSAPQRTGRFRDQQVWIGGSDYGPHRAMFVPPHHTRVPAAIDDLVSFMRREDLGALTQIAVAHAQFETIHPFEDGNGRTGRALVHALLRARGVTRSVTVPLSAGLLVDTAGYFAALDAYRAGDLAPVVVALTDAAYRATGNARALVAELEDIRSGWSDEVRARSDSVVWRIADLLVREPAVDWGLLGRELASTTPSLLRAIDRLVDAEVLVEVTGGQRNRAWVAPQVLAALDGFAARAGRRTRA